MYLCKLYVNYILFYSFEWICKFNNQELVLSCILVLVK